MWENRRDDGNTPVGYEFPLYTDAHIVGHLAGQLGPYSFLNSGPLLKGVWQINAAIILRLEVYIRYDPPDMSKKNDTRYHGGETIADEIAALASLALGTRIRAGSACREFGLFDDPLGYPREGMSSQTPTIRPRFHQSMLPLITDRSSMDGLSILQTIPNIAARRYVNLVRACGAYQEALWVADTDPNLAWMLFVTALETAANDEFSDRTHSPECVLRVAKPEFVQSLEQISTEAVVRLVAEEFSQQLSSTKKFITFGSRFLPKEPDQRPEGEHIRIDWSSASMEKILKKIYHYRSTYLHKGIPFPAPMLDPSEIQFLPPPEVPLLGFGTYSRGGIWTHKDLPINLHCFHYLVRGMLLKWWKESLVSPNDEPTD